MQESFYTSLIEGRVQPDEIERYLESYQIHLEAPFYVITVLHISRSQLPDGISPFLMAVSVKKLAEEQLREQYDSKILVYLGEIAVISQLPDAAEITRYTDVLNAFCTHAKAYLRGEGNSRDRSDLQSAVRSAYILSGSGECSLLPGYLW